MSKKLLNLCMAGLFSMAGTAAWALSEVGGVYQIGTAEDLKAFAELVNGGEGQPYLNAVLTADINKGADETMIGRDGLDYQGCFDGAGHTITIDVINQDADGTAIFRNVGDNALIKDLKVQGTITTSKKYGSGIAAWSAGTIRGCYVDVNVVSAMAGDATHGGIVGVAYQGAMIENCLAKFTINGATTQNSGGIVGWCDGRTNVINCLVINDGSNLDLNNGGSSTIGRNDGNLQTVNLDEYIGNEYDKRPGGASTNNYATNAWNGTKCVTIVPYEDLADGRICYQLNTDQSHIAWVQQIGTDPFPVPAAFGTARVYASAATNCDGFPEEGTTVTYSNSGSDQAAKHAYDKFGICQNCGCFNFLALERDAKDGYYLIKTPEDIDIAEGWNRITNGARFSLKLANDVAYTAEPGRYIFNVSNWFDGNFNGDGHQLTIEMTEMEGNNAALFPKFAGRRFENVIMHGRIETYGQYAGSVAGQTYRDRVNIINTFSDITIDANHGGDNTTGGFIGICETKTQVENCIYAGDINGQESTECIAGFCGWSKAQSYWTNCAFIGNLNNGLGDSKTISRNPGNIAVTNVYSLNEYGYDDTDKFILFEGGAEGVENGELAYFLNGKQGGIERFYQKIGTDLVPMPIKKEGALVYATASSYRCDGAPIGATVYSNTPSTATLPDHKYQDGFCTVCGGLKEDYMTPVDGWFEISTGEQLVWWSNYAAKHLDASAKLTADIDMDGLCDRWANVGTEGAPFYGNFDGQFHTISNLVVDHSGDNGVGLIAVMNSLPEKNYNGISDADARAAEGVYIKNVVLDESCSLTGRGYVGLVGMTAPWAGHVNIKGVMMCGDVTANGGPNASGVFGCVMSSTCHVTIDNCGMTGDVYGPKENGSFSGWLGSYAEVTNCFAVGSVEGIQDDAHYFARYDAATFTNCYARYGTQVPTVSEEDFTSGALAWRANGEQFRTGYWYQDIGTDDYPFPDPSHGTVIFAAEQYFSVANEADLAEVAAAIKDYENDALEDVIATKSVIEELTNAIDALDDAKTILEFADAIDLVNSNKATVAENAKIYQAYIDKCEEIKAFLAGNTTFEGDLRESLEYYLSEVDEPSEDNPLGTYEYIVDEHVATAEEIKAETERVIQWLSDAIAADYAPGTDVSKLIANSDFSEGHNTKWTNGWATGNGTTILNEEGKVVVGVEAWNVTGDMYQTVEGMKPGYYLVGVNAAFRPSNNRYSKNYAAGIYANGLFNYFPTVIEDFIGVDDAEDQVNCNLTGAGAHDLEIYSDYYSTNADEAADNGAELIGYAVHGETGMAAAANAGRYPVYTIAKVGEDGKFTIGIKNPGTKYSSDWTGWGPLTITYCGEEGDLVEGAIGTVLSNMIDRANTILETEIDESNAAASPNFPAALRTELQAAVDSYAAAQSVEDQTKLATKLSDLFQGIYEGKQAYVGLFNTIHSIQTVIDGNLALVEKDDESGEWIDTGNMLFSDDEADAIYDLYDEVMGDGDQNLGIYFNGSYSTEQAQKFASLDFASLDIANVGEVIAPKDDEGYYLLSTPKHVAAYRAICNELDHAAKAKMTADIDMSGIAMLPIGYAEHIWTGGVFDGQGHTLKNVFVSSDFMSTEDPATLFYELKKSTVKNLKLTGEYYSGSKYMGGLTRWMSEGSTVDNCDIAVAIHSAVDGDGTHGGVVGITSSTDEVISNCFVHSSFYSTEGVTTTCVGGVCGWADASPQVKNTLIMNDYVSVSDDGSNTIARNGSTVTNVFVDKTFGGSGGTLVTADQLASGEIAYHLNGNQSDSPVWFQTLGADAIPHLFGGDVVYFYGGKYINETPNPQLNAFAYGLKAEKMGTTKNIAVTYSLNADAESAKVNFYKGSTLVYTADAEVTAGQHKLTVTTDNVGTTDITTLSYEFVVKGKGTLDIVKYGDSYKFNSPYGLAVNNNPASKGFGQVLITETRPTEDREGMFSTGTPGALFAFNAGFEPAGSYYGGLDIANETPLKLFGQYELDLKDLRFSEDGRLFVGRASGTSNSSVWEINPDNLSEEWKPVFTGGDLDEATGITYVGDNEQNRMAAGLALEGKGDDLKMYVLGVQGGVEEAAPTAFNCAVYNLGSAKTWTAAPSGYVAGLDGAYAAIPTHVGIHEDGQGGLWFIQSAGTRSEEIPSIKHFDAAGNEDYSDISTDTRSGKMAITNDGKYIALPMGSGKVVIYETNYVPMANGKIFLNPKYNVATSETQVTGLAFDFAGNLYVASSGSKTLSRYAIPSWNNNVAITPGNAIGTGIVGDTNNDGLVDGIDAQQVLNIMAIDGYRADADVTGDGKVDGNDYQQVLNIMSVQ